MSRHTLGSQLSPRPNSTTPLQEVLTSPFEKPSPQELCAEIPRSTALEKLQAATMGCVFAQAEHALRTEHAHQMINEGAANSLLEAAKNVQSIAPISNQALTQKVAELEKELFQHRVSTRWQEELIAQLERTVEEQRVELEKRQCMINALQRTAATLATASLSRSDYPPNPNPNLKSLGDFSENSSMKIAASRMVPSWPSTRWGELRMAGSQSYPTMGDPCASDPPLPVSSHSSKDGTRSVTAAPAAGTRLSAEHLGAMFPVVKVGHPILLLGNEITRIELNAPSGASRFMVNAHRIWELANVDMALQTAQFVAKHSCPESFVFAKTSARGIVTLSSTNIDDMCTLYVDAALLGALIADKSGHLLPLRAGGTLTEQQANQERQKLNTELGTMLAKLRQKAEELLPPDKRPSAHDDSRQCADKVAGSAIDALAAFAMEQHSPHSEAKPVLSASSAHVSLPPVQHHTLQPSMMMMQQPTTVDEAIQQRIQQRQQFAPRNNPSQLCELKPITEANFAGGPNLSSALEGFELESFAVNSRLIDEGHAKGLLAISFDAMAVVVGGIIMWSNPAFGALAKTLGDGNLELGMQHLRLHFLQDMQGCPEKGPQSSFQDIRGASNNLATKCNIWCVSNETAQQRTILWALSSPAPQAPTASGLVVSDPKLADAHVRVLPLTGKRKRIKREGGVKEVEPQNLWQKYGCKSLQLQAHSNTPVRRAYFKCYIKECLARLTVDSNPVTGKQLKITASGIHNHEIILENKTAATGTVHAHAGDPNPFVSRPALKSTPPGIRREFGKPMMVQPLPTSTAVKQFSAQCVQ